MKLQSINPAAGELIESVNEISDAELDPALERAQQSFPTYRGTSFAAHRSCARPSRLHC
jgi:acyl-CoA reductase-like NAD-dependent aldehyde dehydrogenase